MRETSGADLSTSTLSRLTVRLVPFLFLLYVVAYIDRINVSFAAPQMRQQLGFSDTVYGLGAGIFFGIILAVTSTAALLVPRRTTPVRYTSVSS
jgi:sugar phosphate permease